MEAHIDAILLEAKLKVLHEGLLADGVQQDKVSNSGLTEIHCS